MHLRALITSALLLCAASPSQAQTDRPPASLEAVVGHAAFLDEEPIDHFMFGAALRYPISRRFNVGPEVVYMIGPGHDRDLFLTGNLWFDFVGPRADGVRRATPYLVAGAGLMRYSDRFAVSTFTAHEWAATVGLGVRIALGGRWYIAPEGRLGWEPHSRLSATVGYWFRP